ncbi:MAG: inorganic phosphate transporter, partial [Planctomycetota bacterium]
AFGPLLAALLGAGAAVAGRRLAAARDGRSDAALGIQPGGAAGSGRLLHWVSAGLTSFARGFHDAPKITAVLLAVPALSAATGAAGVALAMAAGGWLLGRGVTRRVSTELAACRPEEGCGANLVTSALVLAASPLGLPVSTTHVSCGAVAGAGLVAERFDRRLFGGFVLAWLVTLPLGAGAAAAARLLV